ncbi:MAG: hypothetical protein L6V95_06960 [Candidatus Melainabacteria bacterium]|nr:MAG: hypothetical protein L6V95_06960 [Candidatus Melainabacteria bacterium]
MVFARFNGSKKSCNIGHTKGTLPTAKTVDKQADEQLTAQKVGNAMAAKINTYVEETYTIMGDKERIEKQKALNATISFLDLAFGGINVKYNENQGWYFVGGATTELVAQTGLYVWSKYAANSIVEKSTTKVLKNAAQEAAREAAVKAAAEKAAELKKIEDEIETVLKNFDVDNKADKAVIEKLTKLTFVDKSDIKTAQKLVKKNQMDKLDNILNAFDLNKKISLEEDLKEIKKCLSSESDLVEDIDKFLNKLWVTNDQTSLTPELKNIKKILKKNVTNI